MEDMEDLFKAEKFSFDEIKNHPELSESGRKFFSDYSKNGPFFDYDKAMEIGHVPPPHENEDLKKLSPSDISWGLKNADPQTMALAFKHATDLQDDAIDAALDSPRFQKQLFQNKKLSNQTIDKIFEKISNKSPDFISANADEYANLFDVLNENGTTVPRKGLSKQTLDFALNSNESPLIAAALRTHEIPFDEAKKHFDHPSYSVREAAFSHPELPLSEVRKLLNLTPKAFYSHPSAKEAIKNDPEIYNHNSFDYKYYSRDAEEAGNPLSTEDADHYLTYEKAPSLSNLKKAFGDVKEEDLNDFIKKHHEHLSENKSVPIDNLNWTPANSKTYWDIIKKGDNPNRPDLDSEILSSLNKSKFQGFDDEVLDHLVNSAFAVNTSSLIKSALDARQESLPFERLKTLAEHENPHIVRGAVTSDAFRNHDPEAGDTPFNNLVKNLLNHQSDYVVKEAAEKIHPDEIENYINHPHPVVGAVLSEKLEPMGIYPQNRKVGISFDTGKLRIARDIAEELGGKVHKKELEKRGLNPANLKISHIQDAKGNISAENIQKHIDGLPKMDFGFSFGEWGGGQTHSKEPSKVFQLQMTKDHLKKIKEEGLWDVFKYIEKQSQFSSHPNARHNALGWVRYTQDKEQKPKAEKEKIQLNMPGHRSHGAFATIENEMPHPQTGAPGFHITFDQPTHVAASENEPETEVPAGTAAWLGQHEIGENLQWKKLPKAETAAPKSTKPNTMIDEVQSDFGQALGRNAEAFARYKLGSHSSDRAIQEYAKSYETNAPSDKREKLSKILYGDRHSNEVLHEAFLQHLRNTEHAGTKVAIWQLDPKARISLRDYPEKPAPVHFVENYDKNPKRMGYQPGKYGSLPTQTSEQHEGKNTWEQTLKKMEELKSRLLYLKGQL